MVALDWGMDGGPKDDRGLEIVNWRRLASAFSKNELLKL
jgi:hypothetical protein